MYQKIILIGNLGKDPEMRYTPNGQPVTNFSMATSEKWTGQDGQPQERTIWWRVTSWGKSGEAVNTYLKKGSKVYVEGRVQADPATGNPRIYTRQDGTPGASFEVTASVIKFLSSRTDAVGSQSGGTVEGEPLPEGEEIPF